MLENSFGVFGADFDELQAPPKKKSKKVDFPVETDHKN